MSTQEATPAAVQLAGVKLSRPRLEQQAQDRVLSAAVNGLFALLGNTNLANKVIQQVNEASARKGGNHMIFYKNDDVPQDLICICPSRAVRRRISKALTSTARSLFGGEHTIMGQISQLLADKAPTLYGTDKTAFTKLQQENHSLRQQVALLAEEVAELRSGDVVYSLEEVTDTEAVDDNHLGNGRAQESKRIALPVATVRQAELQPA